MARGQNQATLITGATRGIGLHLAHRFAKHGHPVCLLAPDGRELETLAEDIASAYGVPVLTAEVDLEQTGSLADLGRCISDSGWVIDILVNNAGHGFRGDYATTPISTHLSMLRLNVEAVLRMTSIFLPEMRRRGHGRVLNVASIAAFEPGPGISVYNASKAFVLSWSEALATELEDLGITVTALCPGPTDTDFFKKGDMEKSFAFQRSNLMDPEVIAREGYEALMRGERLFVPGAINKALIFSRRFMSEHVQAKINHAMYKDINGGKRQRGDEESTPGSK